MTSLPDVIAAYARQTAMEQRARLLDAVWDDVAGERRSVRDGTLPAQLLPAIPGRSQAPAQPYAADLLCCPDGVWRVARDYVGGHPGAGLLEAPVLAPFLPGLCRRLLGENLQLPSLPAWWLGDRSIWPALAADRCRFTIRDAFDPNGEPVALAELPSGHRKQLQSTVDADPCGFVAGLNLNGMLPIRHVIHSTDGDAMQLYG